MSEKDYPPQTLASAVFMISMAAIAGWIVAAFLFVILRHP